MNTQTLDISRITSPAILQGMVMMQQREIAELVEALSETMLTDCSCFKCDKARDLIKKHGA